MPLLRNELTPPRPAAAVIFAAISAPIATAVVAIPVTPNVEHMPILEKEVLPNEPLDTGGEDRVTANDVSTNSPLAGDRSLYSQILHQLLTAERGKVADSDKLFDVDTGRLQPPTISCSETGQRSDFKRKPIKVLKNDCIAENSSTESTLSVAGNEKPSTNKRTNKRSNCIRSRAVVTSNCATKESNDFPKTDMESVRSKHPALECAELTNEQRSKSKRVKLNPDAEKPGRADRHTSSTDNSLRYESEECKVPKLTILLRREASNDHAASTSNGRRRNAESSPNAPTKKDKVVYEIMRPAVEMVNTLNGTGSDSPSKSKRRVKEAGLKKRRRKISSASETVDVMDDLESSDSLGDHRIDDLSLLQTMQLKQMSQIDGHSPSIPPPCTVLLGTNAVIGSSASVFATQPDSSVDKFTTSWKRFRLKIGKDTVAIDMAQKSR